MKFLEPFVMCENSSSLIGIFHKYLLKGFLISAFENSIVDVFRFDTHHTPCIFALRRNLEITFLQRNKLWSFDYLLMHFK